jgi:O-antigen/teichoic acid export membrane protein
MGWVRGMATIFGPVLMARGRTAAMHHMKWIEFIVFAVAIVPAVRGLGILGAAWVLLVVYVLSLVLHIRAVEKDAPGIVHHALAQIGKGLLPGGLAFVLVWGVLQGMSDIEDIHRLAVLAFGVIWGFLVWARERGFLGEIRTMMISR